MNNMLGNLIKRLRKEKKLRLEDLTDKNISKSAISRLEQGKAIEEEKIPILLQKLDIKIEEIPDLVSKMEQEEEISRFVFRCVEAQVRHDVLSFAEFNEKLELVTLSSVTDYLRAKRYFIKGNYAKAIKFYQSVINSNDHCPKMNIKSASYLNLSVISYRNNDYQGALNCLELGLKNFNEQGERYHLKYSLYYNKALILYQLGEIKKADKTLEPAWKKRLSIEDVRTKIQVYQLKASIKRRYEKYMEAVYILQKSLDIAVINEIADGSYYVLVDLGELAAKMDLPKYAERCFHSAIQLKSVLVNASGTLAHLELSRFYFSKKKYKEAKEQVQEGIRAAQKAKDFRKLIQAFIILGSIYEIENNKFDAVSHYKKALQMSEQYNFEQYKPELHERLSRFS